MKRVISSTLTDWEAGQDLIACFDLLSETQHELETKGHPEAAKVLRDAKYAIAKTFNKMKSHDFGLPEGSNERVN